MCGGRGTRLDTETEKPLFELSGTPMVGHVLDALARSRVGAVHAVVSPHTPATTEYVAERGIDCIETPGDGYVEDLQTAIDAVGAPMLTVAADLPLLTGSAVDRVCDEFDGTNPVQVCVSAALKRRLGVSADTTYRRGDREVAPAGINVVTRSETATETMFLTYNARYAVNVNRLEDAAVAEALL